ncbi:transcriptional regulator GcvA [Mesorhizobium sp. M1A.F.Ca.IN.020.06.1.1]|uniref:transcriptional regulator GcvA n=2 Tax=Mesorhizobium TaxID=68287 RepID=UPI000BB0391D|nr:MULTISPECIES: transcriptional regulator GcvA [unclassified Mesorhizobium]PBB30458.1 LysR family transcriptional regulator [Mesorhizobium sp. WSM3882]RUU99784.1 transcriptional regulator GcvA [Mesorhizobium sp. M1A.F.Ca.IN.020.03.2.1]RUV88749.1 transcriptional regulator GcvA [Mesorhizobium sp. M1A.F.Ca.IN.020.32.1.1]RUW11977.1 transcriptional regulator GcvA [Mesorhizobium sp. M1A.F.Ca.IN.022.05.2.1]RUW25471.1 transcriptional regulator GcvA [Mesorhizobium sp. M1A.F.Ca.IN.020.06.1.1]
MAKRLPPLNPLRAFEATARHASLTKAAGELNVTHGAVSHQIKALEQSLGVKLFQRAGQRVKLSPHGAEFLPAVSAAFDGIAAATQRMTRPASTGVLSVSCVPALLLLWMTPRLGSFTAQYPDIQLTLIPSNDARDIRAPHIDVCVHYGDGSWSDCWIRKWSGLELFPVVSPTLINNRPIRSVRDLADHVFLHGDDGREWHTWLAAADALDLERGRRHHLGDARIAVEAAVHGHGVALGDSVTARALLARGMLVAPFALSVTAVDDFYVVCRNEMRSAPIVQLFIDWLFAEKEQDEGRADAPVAGRVPSRRKRPALKMIGARAIPGKV